MLKRGCIFVAAVLWVMPAALADTVFPADAGALSVRDFGAKGDGVADDTQAINAALAASGDDTGAAFWQDKIVYFPAGTYLVSDTIVKKYADGKFASGAVLVGQNRDKTIIKLKDDASGYGDASHPKAVIFTTSKLLDGNATSGGKDYESKGEGNDAYMNFIENLTIDTGKHTGAIGIDYLANNMGAIRHVLVEGEGATGIAMTRKWPGPALLEDVTVKGFDVGVDAANTEYGVTLEHVRLEKQTKVGLRNDRNMLAVHDLAIDGAPKAIENMSDDGLIVMDYKILRGGPPIVMPQASWIPKAKEPPLPRDEAPKNWVKVDQKDWKKDATAAIRKAFASGAHTIYFPHGTYLISENIIVPPSVERIVGMNSAIHVTSENHMTRAQGMFRAENNTHPLVIEHLAFDNSYLGDQVGVEAMGKEPVVLRDVVGAGVITLLRPATGGEAYLEDTCCGTIDIAGDKGVWARQLDTEGPGVRIRNNGAPLWILGLKTEQDCTVLDNSNGARTQIQGGLIYITGDHADPAIPAFRNEKSKLLASYVEEAFNPQATYAVHLVDGKYEMERESLAARGQGRIVPVLVEADQ